MPRKERDEKRRDSKGRLLKSGESQRSDGRYAYKYTDTFGNLPIYNASATVNKKSDSKRERQ